RGIGSPKGDIQDFVLRCCAALGQALILDVHFKLLRYQSCMATIPMGIPLEYGSACDRLGAVVVLSAALGLCSGPLAVALTLAMERGQFALDRLITDLIMAASLALAFAFALLCFLRAPAKSPRRAAAVIGMLAPIFWGVFFVAILI